mmetsp:Transcript_90225/g.291977  ORF Transcript_90225/g.291977 Transcript_90225/m.291977 type:complete len:319 (+) Transcript_90225:867-1823(+)
MRTLCGMRFVSMNSSSAARSVAPTENSPSTVAAARRSSGMAVPSACNASSHRWTSQMAPPWAGWKAVSLLQMQSRGNPRSASTIFFSSQKARTSMFRPLISLRAGRSTLRFTFFWKSLSCFSSSVPTLPLPMMPTATVMSESVKPAWAARRARERSSRATTVEMLRSEEPCAMAMTFTLALPRELRKRPPMPGRLFMPSPMTARMLTPGLEVTRISESRASSRAKACSTLSTAGCMSRSSTATVMECSEEPWEVRMTFTPQVQRASIMRRATPGVPRKLAPARVTSATFSMEVSAFTGKSPSSSSSWSGQRKQSSPRP